jgi:hypothetical protein
MLERCWEAHLTLTNPEALEAKLQAQIQELKQGPQEAALPCANGQGDLSSQLLVALVHDMKARQEEAVALSRWAIPMMATCGVCFAAAAGYMAGHWRSPR